MAEGQDSYLSDNCTPASREAQALGEATENAPWGELHASGKTMFRFSNAWTTDVVEAKTLAMVRQPDARALEGRVATDASCRAGRVSVCCAHMRTCVCPRTLALALCSSLTCSRRAA